jgi:Ni,Fe-hydrogenase III small subunit
MSIASRIFTKSIWVFHLSTGSCNNCDIEILDCLTPKHDLERFGITLVGSIRHADLLLVTGFCTKKNAPRVKALYEQASKPLLVAAVGACACTGGIFRDDRNYCWNAPLSEVIPVDLFIPGCPPKPEAMISGIVTLLHSFTGRNSK